MIFSSWVPADKLSLRRIAGRKKLTPRASTIRSPFRRWRTCTADRSAAARHAFARQTEFPNGRPRYVIDHIEGITTDGAEIIPGLAMAAAIKTELRRLLQPH